MVADVPSKKEDLVTDQFASQPKRGPDKYTLTTALMKDLSRGLLNYYSR